MIKCIIFDFDGVLVESTDIKTQAFAKLYERYGKEVQEKVVDYHMANAGVSRYEKVRFISLNILKEPICEDSCKNLCDEFSSLVESKVASAPYVKGAKEFLERNVARYSFFVVSATPQEEIERIITKRRDGQFFKAVYGAPVDKTTAVKTVLKVCRAVPSEALYVGDALSDYRAASACGVRFIARIYDKEDVFDGIECVKIKDLSGLEHVIGDAAGQRV